MTHNMAVLLNMYLIRICVLYILLLGRVVQNVYLVKLVDKYHSDFISFFILCFMSLIKRSIKVSVTENISFFSCSYVCQFLLKNFAALYIYKYIHKIKLLCPPSLILQIITF